MIDYGIINRAIKHYSQRGFDRIEVPWLVSQKISDVTRPDGCATYTVSKETKKQTKSFVASGEQSLLYMIAKGNLPRVGKYQAVTPCMRDEPFDETHVKCFMKLELITYWHHGEGVNPSFVEDVLKSTVDDAFAFFKRVVREAGLGENLIDVIPTGPESMDINYDGTEIGSYGIRRSDMATWIYGTGVAEPRFSRVIRRVTGKKEKWPDTTVET